MSLARGIVPMKPYCRRCGIPVPKLHRCPKCGRRNWMVVKPPGTRH